MNHGQTLLHSELLSGINHKVIEILNAYVERVVDLYGQEINSIVLYGSHARRDASEGSDIDLLVIIREDTAALRKALSELAWQVQFEHDVVISDVVRSIDQIHHIRQYPYYQNITREGILLWKNTSEPTPVYA